MRIDLPENFRRLKRAPQVILPKDIGIIIAYSGVNKESVCVDAGTGSGWLAVSLAKIAKKVISYELREDFIKIAEKNKVIANVPNLEIKHGDITRDLKEKDVDLITLDMPASEKAIPRAKKSLKENGVIVGYMPHMEQVLKFANKLEKSGFTELRTYECILRDMLVRPEGMRPSTKGVWHTAYLVFARKPAAKIQSVAAKEQ
ncbi:MAG: methyltransferase domain-containing protein [Candidatus Marsarchaeota archaeon]|jgi:tRNA (adenine57-N1/adenine58-N1)-methyltransferase|nr:methyltransferase domain-containing protein [Candidatus Marsarchaeota archaeon]